MSNRIFSIPDGPSLADPCHLIAAWDITDRKNVITFSDFDEIKNYIRKIELKDTENTGYAKATQEIWLALGINTPDEYIALVNSRKNV